MLALAPGSADRDDPRIPPTCPLPRTDLSAWLDESPDPRDRPCTECAFGRSLSIVSGRSVVTFMSCNAPELGQPRLVVADRRATAHQDEVDRRVLAAIRAGMREIHEIAAAAGTPTDGVWKAVRRLKEDGAVPSRLKVRGR